MPLKMNIPGIELRKKSEVHKSIINKFTGRRKREIDVLEQINNLICERKERWGSPGDQVKNNMKPILFAEIRKIKAISRKIKRAVDIMVLGPGEGAEV